MDSSNFRIISVSPSKIEIEILDLDAFKDSAESSFNLGSFLQIKDPDGHSLIAVVQSYRIKDPTSDEGDHAGKRTFVLEAQPVGYMSEKDEFTRGGREIAIPPREVEIAKTKVLEAMYSKAEDRGLCFAELANQPGTKAFINGDRFFGKHIAIVGSTGAGKSCSVAAILQEGIRQTVEQQSGVKPTLNNSHIILFDLHGEYKTAFPSAKCIDISSLILPYWLMNSEELEEYFVDTIDRNNHNQVSQFRQAVLLNKQCHNPTYDKISHDSPVYFDIREVLNFLKNINSEVIGKLANEDKPKLKDGTLVNERKDSYFKCVNEFVESSTAKEAKAKNGPFFAEFDRLIPRIESRLSDSRLHFLTEQGKDQRTSNLASIISQLVGYSMNAEANVVLLDLSGIPFEVLSVVVSLITRLLFDFAFYFKRVKPKEVEIPLLLVYEEAHNYIPNRTLSRFDGVRRSIERIAKEGRKYGVSLMIVSQRPSEINETIFSQCNNYVIMRLTNPADQDYIKRLLPDSIKSLTESIGQLEKQEALVIGDSISLPSRVRIHDITNKPNSNDVKFHIEWMKNWYDVAFKEVIERLLPNQKITTTEAFVTAPGEVLTNALGQPSKIVAEE